MILFGKLAQALGQPLASWLAAWLAVWLACWVAELAAKSMLWESGRVGEWEMLNSLPVLAPKWLW